MDFNKKQTDMDLIKNDNISNENLLHKELTDIIIACFYRVYNDLVMAFWKEFIKTLFIMH